MIDVIMDIQTDRHNGRDLRKGVHTTDGWTGHLLTDRRDMKPVFSAQLGITGDHIKQDLRYTQNPINFAIFTIDI